VKWARTLVGSPNRKGVPSGRGHPWPRPQGAEKQGGFSATKIGF